MSKIFANATLSLRNYYATATEPLRNRYANATQPLRNCYAIATLYAEDLNLGDVQVSIVLETL